jgi:hypothetical protein
MKKWLLDWFFLCYERIRNKCFEGIALPNPVNCVNQANRNVIMFSKSNAATKFAYPLTRIKYSVDSTPLLDGINSMLMQLD